MYGEQVFEINSDQFKNNESTSEIITEILKKVIPDGVRGKISTKKDRQLLLEKFGEKAFLLPDQLKFPVVNPRTGKYDCALLYAATIRARQYLGVKSGYREVYKKAKELYKQHGCGGKIHIKIHEGDVVINTNLTQLMEIFY